VPPPSVRERTPVRLILGTADFKADAVTPRILDRFVAAGGRAIDVANVYGEGESERAVGKWLGSRASDDLIVLYGKGCHPPYCSPDLVRKEVEEALTLLGVERLDVFMLHRDDAAIPVGEWADALQSEVDGGRIGGFGVSNWTLSRFRELEDYAGAGDGPVVFSNHFSLGEMVRPSWPGCLALTKDELGELLEGDVEVLAWASLAMGYFAGRDAPSWESAENEARRSRARTLARELGTTAHAVALAYILHQPPKVRPVIGTRSEAHLDEALSAARIELTDYQLTWLETG
jgi:aryl-alcohol dehydrogenase-like predicted oxidoreductase